MFEALHGAGLGSAKGLMWFLVQKFHRIMWNCAVWFAMYLWAENKGPYSKLNLVSHPYFLDGDKDIMTDWL